MTTVLDGAPAPAVARGNRRWWALGALGLAGLAVGVDGTVLSVALPTLSRALHASESDLQWFSSGYFLVLAAAMLPAGLLGDRYGRKKVLLISLALFGIGSAACAYSTSVAEFMAARVLIGLGGAGIIVMAFSVLTVLFSKTERPKAVGVMSAVTFVAFPIGPILGGWLLSSYWWGWVFLINVPVVVIGLAAVIALVPESRASQRPGLDPVGVAASAAGLVALTYGLIQAGQGAVPANRIVRLVGAKVAVAAGFVLLAAGLAAGAMTSVSSGGLYVAAWLAVAGLGTGIAMATAMSAALVELSGDKSGVGSAVLQAVNKTGGPLGIAILGSVLSAGYLARLHLSGLPAAAAATVRQSVFGGVVVAQKIHSASLLASVQAAFVHGMDLALAVSAGIAVAGVVLTLVFLPASNAPKKTVQPVMDRDGEAAETLPAITGQAA
jgi:MFS family permease